MLLNNVRLLKILFLGMALFMIWLVINTSLRSNFWAILPDIGKEPWFVTTLVDFYFNVAILSAWVLYKEKVFPNAVLWIMAFVCLGSIATCFYVFLQLLSLKEHDMVEKVLLKASARK